jgi:hypothetical protein
MHNLCQNSRNIKELNFSVVQKFLDIMMKIKSIVLFLVVVVSGLNAESTDPDRKQYLKNLKKVANFKKNMPKNMVEYYLPRKKYIDKQPVTPLVGPFYQIQIIVNGSKWRDKHMVKNSKEIKKLEEFLKTADDFELSRYFTPKEEKYLSMKSSVAIQKIRYYAKLDENWRKKNDPIFSKYIEEKASQQEKKYYKKHKSRFYSYDSGWDLVQILQKEAFAND